MGVVKTWKPRNILKSATTFSKRSGECEVKEKNWNGLVARSSGDIAGRKKAIKSAQDSKLKEERFPASFQVKNRGQKRGATKLERLKK